MWRVMVITALAVVLVACGGRGGGEPTEESRSSVSTEAPAATDVPASPSESATDAFERLIDYFSKGQYGRAWDEMHPSQQALIAREDYMLCQAKKIGGADIEIVDIVDVYSEDAPIPGTGLVLPSTAITFEVRITGGLFEDTTTDTSHEFDVDGEWRWVVNEPDEYDPATC